MFSLSTFSSKAKESSASLRSGHSYNRTSYQHQQPKSLSGLPLTSTGELTTNSSRKSLYSNYVANGSNNENKFPLLNSAGVSPTLMTPSNFRVTRRVGSDSLLVAWTTPDDDEINGYLVRNYNIKGCITGMHYLVQIYLYFYISIHKPFIF